MSPYLPLCLESLMANAALMGTLLTICYIFFILIQIGGLSTIKIRFQIGGLSTIKIRLDVFSFINISLRVVYLFYCCRVPKKHLRRQIFHHPLGSARARNTGVTTEVVGGISRSRHGADKHTPCFSAICTLDG